MTLTHVHLDDRGSTLVEFTIALPFFMLLTVGIIEAGLLMWSKAALQHGVEMAARCASASDAAIKFGGLNPAVNATPCYQVNGNAAANAASVKALAALNAYTLNPPTSTFSVGSCTGGNLVSATYPFTALQFVSYTLSVQSCYPKP